MKFLLREHRKWGWKKRIVITLGVIVTSGLFAVGGINIYVTVTTNDRVVSDVGGIRAEKLDCILVLGALVRSDGTPSHMLRKRLEKSLELYKQKVAPKILVSGDNSSVHYNETHVMWKWLEKHEVPKEDIFEDHAGFSTYESMYRASAIFKAHSIVVVTQRYHLARSIYIGRELGLDVWGIASGGNNYSQQFKRDVREWIARTKDFVQVVIKPKPKYLGPVIPIDGNGTIENR